MKPGDTVIVLGSGPIGLFVQKFAKMKGAKRVIAVDNVDRKSTRLNSSHQPQSRMPSSA